MAKKHRRTQRKSKQLSLTKRTIRDNLFRSIYGGKDERSKRWLLSLYNALTGKNYTDISELEITTIEDVIYVTVKNDLSFLINSEMNLFEQQSTVNPNMPLRGFVYFAQLYQKHVKKKGQNIYGSTRIKIPSPRFAVFYNGSKEQEDIKKYRLSDLFEVPDESGEFEWTATVYNINKSHNESLQKKCKSLYDYCAFVNRLKENLARNMKTEDAVNEAVDFAIEGNFLEGYFKEQRMQIVGNLLTDFDQKAYNYFLRKEGYDEGAQANARENARNLLRLNKLSSEEIALCCSLPLEQVLAIKSELVSEAQTVKN